MIQRSKERIVGTIVLVVLATIFIPMIFKESVTKEADKHDLSRPVVTTDLQIDLNQQSDNIDTAVDQEPPPSTELQSRPLPLEQSKDVDRSQQEDQGRSATSSAQIVAPQIPPPKAKPDSPSSASKKPRPAEQQQDLWVVQIGSFNHKANAEKLNQRAQNAGFSSLINTMQQDGKTIYRVWIGPTAREDVFILQRKLYTELKLEGIIQPYLKIDT